MAGSAIPTTVASIEAIADPRTVAASTQRPGPLPYLSPAGSADAAAGVVIVASRSPGQGRHEQGLDGVHPVLGLLEYDRPCGLENLLGDLGAVEAELLEDPAAERGVAVVHRRQAVHEAGT